MSPDSAPPDVSSRIERIVRDRLPAAHQARPLVDETAIGEKGLGLDSIDVVELLIECEEEFGVTISPELLEHESLTVGGLSRIVTHAVGALRSPSEPS